MLRLFLILFLLFTVSFGQGKLELTLSDTIELMLKNNSSLKSDLLSLESKKQFVQLTENKFDNKLTFSAQYSKNKEDTEIYIPASNSITHSTIQSDNPSITVASIKKLQAGTEISTSISGSLPNSDQTTNNIATQHKKSEQQTLEVTVKQPLLKDYGKYINKLPIEIAKKEEEVVKLEIQESLNQLIFDTVKAWYELYRTNKNIAIYEEALQRAKKQYEKVNNLIAAGRVAKFEALQLQTDIKKRELDLLEAQNKYKSAKLTLLKLLDLPDMIDLVPNGELAKIKRSDLDLDRYIQLALKNWPSYKKDEISYFIAKKQIDLYKNNKDWDLSLEGSYKNSLEDNEYNLYNRKGDDKSNSWNLGLSLSKTFGDYNADYNYKESKINLMKKKLALNETSHTMKIEIAQSIQNINFYYSAYLVAKENSELHKKKFEVESKKLAMGHSSVFQLSTYEDELTDAQVNKISALVDYLVSLNFLHMKVGTIAKNFDVKVKYE